MIGEDTSTSATPVTIFWRRDLKDHQKSRSFCNLHPTDCAKPTEPHQRSTTPGPCLLGNLDQLKAMADDWIGVRSGSRVNFAERIAELDKQIATQKKAVNITISMTAKQIAMEEEEISERDAEKRVAEVVAPLQQELAKLQKDRSDIASWQEESDAAGERITHLINLAEMANRRLHNMPLEKQHELMVMLESEVTIVGDAPQGRMS